MTTLNIVVVLGLLGAVICAPTGDLAGPEFLEVFMRSREPRRSAYYITDNIIHNEVKTTEAPTTTQLPVTETTESTTWLEPEEREVVKVSVTTSIGRQLSKPEEPSLASTADEPTITAVQRSHFGVDESSGELSIKQEAPESRFTVERSQNGENTSFTVRQIHQGDSSSSFTIQTKIPDKVEERTSYSVDAKQEKADKEEETVVEQRTFSTESRSAPSKSPVKNWHYDYTPKQKEQQNWPPNGQYERNSRDYRQKNWEYQERVYGEPEKNYEIDESVSVMSNGRVHGAQGSTTNPNKNGYVVEGSNYRKYRVEEKTPDGFIVGEYGVVSHDDGSLRGVRYTADSNINPRLIYDALVKFLSLK